MTAPIALPPSLDTAVYDVDDNGVKRSDDDNHSRPRRGCDAGTGTWRLVATRTKDLCVCCPSNSEFAPAFQDGTRGRRPVSKNKTEGSGCCLYLMYHHDATNRIDDAEERVVATVFFEDRPAQDTNGHSHGISIIFIYID